VIGQSSFAQAVLARVLFRPNSSLIKIEAEAFAGCEIQSICIPKSVEILENDCFRAAKIGTLTFEKGSRLRMIGDRCFNGSTLTTIVLPVTVQYVGASAFPRMAKVASDRSLCADYGSRIEDFVAV
jgi:hypothetical protein